MLVQKKMAMENMSKKKTKTSVANKDEEELSQAEKPKVCSRFHIVVHTSDAEYPFFIFSKLIAPKSGEQGHRRVSSGGGHDTQSEHKRQITCQIPGPNWPGRQIVITEGKN